MQRLKQLFRLARRYGLLYAAILAILGLSLLWVWPRRGLTGYYYDNLEGSGEPVMTRLDRRLTLDAISQRQDTFPQRRFRVIWRGWIMIPKDGEYGFSTKSDDGSSVVLDTNVLVVDNGGFHPARKASGTMFLPTGLHSIEITYYQGEAAYSFQAYWQQPGKAESGIPPHVLYPQPFPIRGIGFLTRHLNVLYPVAWGFLLLVIIGRRLIRDRENLSRVFMQYAQNIGMVVVTILIFGLIAEGVMRLTLFLREQRKDVKLLLEESRETDFEGGPRTYSLMGIVQESPYRDIVYELKPNLRGNFRGVPLVTNPRGLRDFEYSYRKPENTFRIVGLGDSSLFGWGVRLEETSMKVLERELNTSSSGKKYEAINFAVPGYNTAIEVEVFLRKCLKYSPDLAIMHFNTNDYDVPGFMKPPQSASTLKKSYFLSFLYSRLQLLGGEHEQEMLPFIFDRTLGLEESERLDEDPAFPEEYRHMVGKRGFLSAMDKLVTVTQERGIPLIVYVVKAYPGLDPSYKPNAFRDRQLELITQLSQEKGFFLLNIYPAYMQYRQEHSEKDNTIFWVSETDSHPSALGHRLEAETLYTFVKENKLVPE